jgi:DNA-binding IclR family transcriptional regulator
LHGQQQVILTGMTSAQRLCLPEHTPLETFTHKTLTQWSLLKEEIKQVKRQGFALDNEEF